MNQCLLSIIIFLGLFSCTGVSEPNNSPSANSLETLEGSVIHKPWTKSSESWMAGGSDYFVLDTGENPVQYRTAEEGVILQPTEQVTRETLANYENQLVRVKGEYRQPQPVTPEPGTQYPIDFDGNPLPSGGGFAVYHIEEIRDR